MSFRTCAQLREEHEAMREMLREAYQHITQPRRMTQTTAEYDVRNYNRLTAKIRAILHCVEAEEA